MPGSFWKSRRAFSRLMRHIAAISASVKCRSANVSTTKEPFPWGSLFRDHGSSLKTQSTMFFGLTGEHVVEVEKESVADVPRREMAQIRDLA
jgi:hypothetical protein